MQSQKRQNDLCLFPRQIIHYHSNPSLCLNQLCWRSWNWMVLWRPTRPSRTNTQNRCPFHYRGLECKIRSQEIPRITGKLDLKLQNEAAQSLTEFLQEKTGHSKYPLPATRDDSMHDHQMVNTEIRLIIFFAVKDGEALCSQQTQNWELTVTQIMNSLTAKFRLKLKKVGKTTRAFSYDLN